MGSNKNRILKDLEQEIIDGYLNNQSSSKLSKKYGVSESSILRVLVRNNIPRRNPGSCDIKEEVEKREVGKTYNYLTVIKRISDPKISKRLLFICKCICEEYTSVSLGNLKSGSVKSCGCQKANLIRSVLERKDKQNQLFEYLFKDYKKNAIKRSLNFDLSDEDFKSLIFNNCYYCGNAPNQLRSNFKFKDKDVFYNGIDRLNNNIGYSLDNCVSCCKICNYSKRNYDFQEYINWIERSYNHLKSQNLI